MQHQTVSHPVSLFCVSASADATLLAQWETHLLPLQQTGLLTFWSERHLLGGEDRTKQSVAHLDQADCILFLMSADFFADDACLNVMQHALLRKQTSMVVIIPLLLRPVEWQESDLGSLSCLPTNGVPITGWPDPDEAFHVCLRELRALLDLPLRVRRVSKHERVRTNKNRERMLRRLSRSYQDLLDQSLQGIAWMELGFTKRPNAVQNATNLTLRIAQQPEQPLAPGVSIIQVYEDAEQELLILGEPGAGKSTELLHLAQHLVAQAEQDETGLLPVILPLSSWAVKRSPLGEWMEEQFTQIYDIPRKVSRQWVQEEQILPLLDGLDEMEEDARPACMAAINTYHHAHLTPLVVCSRLAEYERASSKQRLTLQSAIVIRPLTLEQVGMILHEAGEVAIGLRTSLHLQPELEELTTNPLMLSVLMLTYQGATIRPDLLKKTDLEQQIWIDYVQRMMERKKQSSRKQYTPEQIQSWLGWLACQMRLHNQAVFYAEQLREDWLPERLQRTYVWLVVRLPDIIIGVVTNLLIWIFLGQLTDRVSLLQCALLGGFLGGWLSQSTTRQIPASTNNLSLKKRSSHILDGLLGSSLILGVLFGATFGLDLDGVSYFPMDWLRDGIIYGVCFWLSGWIVRWWLFHITQLSSSPLTSFLHRFFFRTRGFNSLHLQRAASIALIWGFAFGLIGGENAGLDIGLNVGLASLLLGVILENRGKMFSLAERLHWNGWHLIRPKHLRDSLLVAGFLFLIFVLNAGLKYGIDIVLSPFERIITDITISATAKNIITPVGNNLTTTFNNAVPSGPIPWIDGWNNEFIIGLSVGLSVGLSYWLLLGLFQGLQQEQVEALDRRIFNQGIHRSFRNGILISMLSGSITMALGILSYALNFGLNNGLANWLNGPAVYYLTGMSEPPLTSTIYQGLGNGLNYGWLFALSSGWLIWATIGGLTVLQHYAIRLLLSRSHTFPWQAQAFLDNASAHILMRRVGGGYSFVHRRLLDYFADTALVPANRSNVVYQNPSVPPSMSDSLPESARSEDL